MEIAIWCGRKETFRGGRCKFIKGDCTGGVNE